MRDHSLPIGSKVTLLAMFAVTLFAPRAQAASENVLHNFSDSGKAAYGPRAGLIFDSAGNLYGTTVYGGADSFGAVFELTPKVGGGWTGTILHSFNGQDGYLPYAGLIFDASGNLYGTTFLGGAHGRGTVFELTPKVGGGWTKTVLHSFDENGQDGEEPYAGLIFDLSGNLYGTTQFGGTGLCSQEGVVVGCGAVFELSPAAGGDWTETVLHSFDDNSSDGQGPLAGLIFDAAGNLYGTTQGGGAYNFGAVFELTPQVGGGWTEMILHSFDDLVDGAGPQAGLIFDPSGNLYGTTVFAGPNGYGTVFELTPQAGGSWMTKVLHGFGNIPDGGYPYAGLLLDADGNLYGTTVDGGASPNPGGAVFELTPLGGGGWTENVLHSFGDNLRGGSFPYAGLIFDIAGNLYGTTVEGGTYNYGTVFEISP
jgi:uncharacterized repeat protein (TIGR03803 family)